MKYTSNKKIDFNKMVEKRTKTGFSDKIKKNIAKILLAIQVISAVPAYGNTESVINSNHTVATVLTSESNQNEIDKKIIPIITTVSAYSDRANMDKENPEKYIKEFENFNKERIELFEKIQETGEYSLLDNLSEFDEKTYNYMKENKIPILLPSSALKFTKGEDGEEIPIIYEEHLYSADEVYKIKQFYDNHFREVLDNSNLNQKEKFFACMKIATHLYNYDYLAFGSDNNEYMEASAYTSRNQYASIKYGETVCAGYADTLEILGGMLGVKVTTCLSMAHDDEKWEKLSDEAKEEIRTAIENNEDIEKESKNGEAILDHAVNMVTFDDGTSYLIDLTNYDDENYYKDSDSESESKKSLLTNAENFEGAYRYKLSDGKVVPIILDSKLRNLAINCQMMPREEIERMEKKVSEEINSLQVLEDLDRLQTENGYTYKRTAREYMEDLFTKVFKPFNLIDKFKSKFSTPSLALPNGDEQIYASNKFINEKKIIIRKETLEIFYLIMADM